jgi:hypothetical protein
LAMSHRTEDAQVGSPGNEFTRCDLFGRRSFVVRERIQFLQ